MKKIFSLFVIAMALLTGVVHADDDGPEYSADMVITENGTSSPKMKIHVAKNFVRVDGPGDNYTIVNMIRRTTTVVMPEKQVYMQVPLDVNRMPRVGKLLDREIKRDSFKKEKVSGYDTEEFIVTHHVAPEGIASEVRLQWLRSDNVTVKIADGDEGWNMTMSNIVTGKQRSDLFDVPSDYKRFDMPY